MNILLSALRIIGPVLLALSLGGCIRVWTWGDQPSAASAVESSAQASTAQAARVLAPTGVLRVGVYAGSPTSWVKVQGQSHGIAHDLGHALGERLGVPVQLVEFPRVAEVVQAVHDARVDFTFTNASASRAQLVDFTAPLVRLELGLLVPRNSNLKSLADLDQPHVRLGVTQGSSSQATLSARLKLARISAQPSLTQARQALASGELDAFATNKGILFELADQLPQHRVLDDAWGHEQLAIAIPQGRGAAMPWLQEFAATQVRTGALQKMANLAGLRGLAPQP
jgi:polar amino acid transport system substrate-binding protein